MIIWYFYFLLAVSVDSQATFLLFEQLLLPYRYVILSHLSTTEKESYSFSVSISSILDDYSLGKKVLVPYTNAYSSSNRD